MTQRVNYVEPLLEKIKSLIKAGERNCLERSLNLYGSEDDILTLVQLIETSPRKSSLLIVDISPFMSLGTETRLQRLEMAYRSRPYVLLVKKGIVLEQLEALGTVSTIVIDDDYKVIEHSFVGAHAAKLEKQCSRYLARGTDAFALHSRWLGDRLCQVVPKCIRMPPAERRYTRLVDDQWANFWIDVKGILGDPNEAFFIAYQLGYVISRGYGQAPTEDVFVAGNNNAYVLASFLHHIYDDKELVMLDRLGPYPSLSRTRLLDSQRVEGKKCCVVEDVLGTGRETDLITLLVFLAKGKVERVACLYDLEIASPLLVPKDKVLSLCRPSLEIGYERLAKYKVTQGDND